MNKKISKMLALVCASSMALSLFGGCVATPAARADESAASDITYSAIQVEYKAKDTNADWNAADCTAITLGGTTAECSGAGVTIDGSTVTITAAGDYVISGTLEGSIVISATENDDVRLIFNGAQITSPDGPAINCQVADKLIITLADGTENTISDSATYTAVTDGEPDAAIYSKTDLSINGTGTLNVTGNYANGILTKDDLKICGGIINVTAAKDALRGRDSVAILDGTITLNAQNDGIKSNYADSAEKGWIVIDGGTITITAGGDGIQAESVLQVNDGTLDIITGGGSENGVTHTSESFGGRGGFTMPDGTSGATTNDGSGFGGHGGGNRGTMPDGATLPDGSTMPEMPDGSTFPEMPDGATPPEMPDGATMPGTDATSSGDSSSDSTSGDTSDSATVPDSSQMNTGAAAQDGFEQLTVTTAYVTGLAEAADSTAAAATDTTSESTSYKGLKCTGSVYVNGGTIDIDSADDALHCNADMTVNGGTISIATGDDAMHADDALTINGGDIDVSTSYEGLEAVTITLNGGNIKLVSSDDGINAAGGADSSGFGGFGGDMFGDGGQVLYINGGFLEVNASGDGLDSNGSIYMTGGVVLVSGPTDSANGALDYNSEFQQTGGVLVAAGASGMMQSVSSDSTQPCISVFYTATQEAGTRLTLTDESGNVIVSYAPEKAYQCAVISAPGITTGESCLLYTGGTASDSEYATGGTLSDGTQLCSISVSDTLVSVSSDGSEYSGGMGNFFGGRGGMKGGW